MCLQGVRSEASETQLCLYLHMLTAEEISVSYVTILPFRSIFHLKFQERNETFLRKIHKILVH